MNVYIVQVTFYDLDDPLGTPGQVLWATSVPCANLNVVGQYVHSLVRFEGARLGQDLTLEDRLVPGTGETQPNSWELYGDADGLVARIRAENVPVLGADPQ